MNNSINPTTQPLFENNNPWLLLLITLGVTMVGFQLIGAFFGVAVAYPFYHGDMMAFMQAMTNPTSDPAMRTPLLIVQGIGSITGFILMPWLLLKFFYHGHMQDLSGSRTHSLLILLTIMITLFFMGVNAPFIEWNQNLTLPEAFSNIEEKLKMLEDALAKTSTFITQFDGIGQLLLGILVVSIIPGIGEEFVFRGLVQNHIYRISKNIHVAIWFGALLFSLFHLQFYGLVPRMFLGALFGYLYYYSGNIIYPMVAHMFNNGFTLVMLYLYQQHIVDYNIEESDALPWTQVFLSVAITLFLFISFKRNAKLRTTDE